MPVPKTISEVTREALLLHPQGLTVRELAKLTGYTHDLLIACLRRNYGFYIADFKPVASKDRRVNAVWCCVAVPANAIKPPASEFPVEVVDTKQEEYRRAYRLRRDAAKKERIKQEMANKRIREAAKKKPTPPEYKPLRTTWVTVPSWSSVGAGA